MYYVTHLNEERINSSGAVQHNVDTFATYVVFNNYWNIIFLTLLTESRGVGMRTLPALKSLGTGRQAMELVYWGFPEEVCKHMDACQVDPIWICL